MLAETDIEKIINIILDFTLEVSAAERGMIILCNEKDDGFYRIVRDQNKNTIPESELKNTVEIIDIAKISGAQKFMIATQQGI